MLLLLMLVACTEDAAEVDNLVRGEEYVQVRMQVPGMKAAATRAEDGVIKSITALVYRGGVLKKIETATELTTTSFKMPKPQKDDVIHFLANLPDKYSLPEIGTEESALCDLTTDHQTLCYWGKYTYNDEAVINTLTLYRNMAMITIAPDPNDECTFPEDQLFIAGLVNANQTGALVPYDNVKKAFNFDLGDNDYYTLPSEPNPLAQTEELNNYGAGYDTSLYVLEHDNPETEEGLYVICKIGKYYYKVALTSDGVNPYDIIRNHKYTIYVHDLDEGARTYADALTAKPINLRVIMTTDLVFTYTDNSTVYLNGGKNATLPVQITVPQDASLTEFNIATTNFTVTSSGGALTQTDAGYTYAGGSTTFTFTPKSGLAAGTYTITLSGKGNYLYNFNEEVSVTVDATMMAVTAKDSDATLDMDGGDTSVTFVLTKPNNVDNVSISTDVFNVSNNGNEYTFTPKNNNIAAGNYTVTFADSNYQHVSTEATITVVNTPKVTFTNTGAQTIKMNGTHTVTMNIPNGKSLSEFGITISPATGLNVAQGGNELTLTDGVYSTTSGMSGEQTFTFTPTATGTYTITFSGSGTDVNMPAENNRTINLTVEAAVVTGMSVTAVNGDSTIDLDSGDTNVTFTLTKPTNQNNVKVTFDAKTFIINDNQGHQSNEYWINNSSETVEVKFALRNNDVAAGDYTVTFVTGDNQMSATATITIKKTPTVSFSNTSDKTLYWNNNNPTSFDVEMTGVPDGKSVTLSIANASAFTITASSGTLSATNNGYSYIGGNTTFTITPNEGSVNETTPYSITFTDANDSDGVIVPNTSISVKVEATQPAVQEIVIYGLEHNNSETGINFGNYLKYDLLGSGGTVGESLKGYFTAGATLVIEVSNIESGAYLNLQTSWTGIFKSYDLANSQDRSYVFSGTDFTGGTFTTDNGNNINNAGLCLVGNKLTITKISIIPASTQQQ